MPRHAGRRSRRAPARTPSDPPRDPGVRSHALAWASAAGLTAWSFGFSRMLNSDLWFHLAAGRLIAEERAVPETDSWSFTAAGSPWQNHEWLAGLLFHGWERLFGVESLVFWLWGLLVATFLVLHRVLLHLARSELSAYLILLFTVATASPFFDIRPHVYSLLGYAVLLHQGLVRPRISSALPLLFLVWANLHGGVVFGLATLFIVSAASIVRPALAAAARGELRPGLAEDWRRTALLTGGCLAAALINPFGWRALVYPFEVALAPSSPSRTILVEWLSPWIEGGIPSPLLPHAIALAVGATLVLLALRGLRDHPRRGLIAVALAGLTLAMAWESRRFVPLFAMSQGLLVAAAVGHARLRRASTPARRRRRGSPAWRVVLPVAAILFALWRLSPYPLTSQAFAPMNRMGRLPVETMSFVEVNGLSGRVFSYFQWAGYVHYRTAGRFEVFLDPRSETVFDAATQRSYYQVQNRAPGWQRVLDEAEVEYVLWPVIADRRREVVVQLLASGRWMKLYQDAVSALLVRIDVEVPPSLGQTPPSAYRSFAEARSAIGQGRLDDAERHLEHALRQKRDLLAACHELAAVQRAKGALARADASSRRCRDIFPPRT